MNDTAKKRQFSRTAIRQKDKEKSFRTRRPPSVFQQKKRVNCGHNRESNFWHPRIAKTSRKINVKWERIKRRIHLPVQKEKAKETCPNRKRKRCKSQAEDCFREALASRNFHEHPLEGRGKPRASVTIQNAHQMHSCAQKKTSV